MVYLMSLPGGWIADRLLGQRRAVLVRRHPDRAAATSRSPFPRSRAFYLGPRADRARHRAPQAQHQRHRRPALRARATCAATPAFSIFYMGINLGAFIGPLITGYLAQSESFRARLAGLGTRSELGVALGVRRGRRRHDARPHAVRPRRRTCSATPDCIPCSPASPETAVKTRRRARHVAVRRARSSLLVAAVAIGDRRRSGDAGQIAGAYSYLLLARHGRVLRLAVPRRRLDAGRAQAPLRHRRVLRRGGALLVGLRAGRARRSTCSRIAAPATRSSATPFPSSWWQSLNALLIFVLRAGLRVAVGAGSASDSRRARPSSRSA